MINTPQRLVHVPPGVQCFVGDEARGRRRIEETVVQVFEGWDYEEIIPPLYDYAEVFAGPALSPKTYSFVGRDGSVLALRPDFTSLLAKVAAGRLRDRPAPIRLYYSGEVLRYEPPKAGRQSELHQMGLEHLGGERSGADAEVLAIAAESWRSATSACSPGSSPARAWTEAPSRPCASAWKGKTRAGSPRCWSAATSPRRRPGRSCA
jgi:ATP phosphoribosyltransferase regulatory subunit